MSGAQTKPLGAALFRRTCSTPMQLVLLRAPRAISNDESKTGVGTTRVRREHETGPAVLEGSSGDALPPGEKIEVTGHGKVEGN